MKPTTPTPSAPTSPAKSLPPLGPLRSSDFTLGVEVTEVLGDMPADLLELFQPKKDDNASR